MSVTRTLLPDLLRRPTVWIAALYTAGIAVTLHLALTHRNFLFDYDARFWFLGGVMWLRGLSPYDHGQFVDLWLREFGSPPAFPSGFVYPGTILPLSLLLGAFPWSVARHVMRALNLACYGLSLAILHRRFVRDGSLPGQPARRAFWVAVSAATPGMGIAIFQGQVAPIVTLGLVLAWTGLAQRRTGLCVLAFVLAGIKPQVSLVPLVFLLVRHWHRRAAWAVAAVVALSALPLLWSTPAGLLEDLRASVGEHMQQGFNDLSHYDSLPALLGATRLRRLALWAGIAAGVVAAVLLGCRARLRAEASWDVRALQIALVAAAALMPVHRYDLAVHLLLLATAWALGPAARGIGLFALVAAQGASYWVALRLVRPGAGRTGSWDTYMSVASDIATAFVAAELIFLLVLWFADRRRMTTPGPGPKSPF
ncbi:MAG: DUF2029 domain-containing protein [Planctomycetes bacterium]|jgi:hypothetical protein|nr:DUF2029 domain-containing protein [Planctomycetota bacterium]